jgi:hypothetical protein
MVRSVKMSCLCVLTVAFLAASVVLNVNDKDSFVWSFMTVVSASTLIFSFK